MRSLNSASKRSLSQRKQAAEMFQVDLEAAGLPYRDDAGLVADFHSLRHTFITNLAPGETLLFYSDGLFENRDAAGREFGEERFAADDIGPRLLELSHRREVLIHALPVGRRELRPRRGARRRSTQLQLRMGTTSIPVVGSSVPGHELDHSAGISEGEPGWLPARCGRRRISATIAIARIAVAAVRLTSNPP